MIKEFLNYNSSIISASSVVVRFIILVFRTTTLIFINNFRTFELLLYSKHFRKLSVKEFLNYYYIY